MHVIMLKSELVDLKKKILEKTLMLGKIEVKRRRE